MILQSFLVYLPSLLAGVGLAHLLWKNDQPAALLVKVFSGIGLGLGITSCLYFLRLISLPGQGGYLLIQFLFLFLVTVALFAKKRVSLAFSFHALPLNWYGILLGLTAILVGVVALYYLVVFSRLSPHGDYDAQAIWNLRARFMYRSGAAWETAFSPLINRNFHMDYPLLIPVNVIGGWNTLGSEVLRVPAMLSMLFLVGMAGVLYATLAWLRSASQAAIAAIVLLATPGLLLFSTFQTSDIPLTYFFLASVSLFVLASAETNSSLFFLSGMMAGLSAWTKNEGIPFVLLLFVFTGLVFGLRQARVQFLALLAGCALPLLTIFLFKTLIAVNNDLFTNNGLSEILGKLLDPARYLQIITHLAGELLQLGNWPISILVLLLVYGWIIGVRTPAHFAEKAAWTVPAAQLLLYLFVYVVTPHELQWHMNYSMSRLLIHVFPAALFAYFLFVNTPEAVLNKVK